VTVRSSALLLSPQYVSERKSSRFAKFAAKPNRPWSLNEQTRQERDLPLEGDARCILECSRQTCLILGPYRGTRDESCARPVGSYEHVARTKTSNRPVNSFVSCQAISSPVSITIETVIAKFIYSHNCSIPLYSFIEICVMHSCSAHLFLKKKRISLEADWISQLRKLLFAS